MSVIAVRIAKIASDGSVAGNVDFYRHEVARMPVRSAQDSEIQRAQNGAPTLFIATDEFAVIEMTVRNYGKSTTDKFTELRNFINAGGILRVYYKYFYEVTVSGGTASAHYDCFILPHELPVDELFSGEYSAGRMIKLRLYETSQSSQYTISDDIVIEG